VGGGIYGFRKAEGAVVAVCNVANIRWSMAERSVCCMYSVSGLQVYVWSLSSGSKLGQRMFGVVPWQTFGVLITQ
jgi:hypothetical protein